MSGRVARRYAKALFVLAGEARALDAVGLELQQLRAAIADPATLALLASPAMTAPRLADLARQLAQRLHLSALTAHFLGVLARNRRLDQVPGIYDRFEAMHDRALGRIRVVIRSATPLDEPRQRELVAAFERLTGKTVLATVTITPALLGGVVVEAEGKVYDGSLRTQLDHMARGITGARTYL
jgi:F-type H+-transporting ATPase subunit delta